MINNTSINSPIKTNRAFFCKKNTIRHQTDGIPTQFKLSIGRIEFPLFT